MTIEEINGHKAMKKKHADYPKLPKRLLSKPEKCKLDGHIISCLRGFYKRLSNWERSAQDRMANNI
jgi:hypothetical protein